MIRYELISFDLDGTLVDSASEIVEACNRTFADFDVPARSYEDVVNSIGQGTRPLMMQQLAKVLLEQPSRADHMRFDHVLDRFSFHYAATVGTTAHLYPGTRKALEELQHAGIHRVCVTNKEEKFAIQVLEKMGIRSLFSLVIGGDTMTVKKPHRRTIDHCLNYHQIHSRCAAHVGDSSVDIETARNAGVAAWAVPYGYNNGRPIHLNAPDQIFDQLDQLSDAVIHGALQPRTDVFPSYAID